MTAITQSHMGEVWPQAEPGRDGAHYATLRFSPGTPCQVRSFQTLKFDITVGEFGLDDTGAIKIVQRWTYDGGALQTHDPGAMNYVTARASNGVEMELDIERYPHQRPWYNGLRVTVKRGYLSPGDTIQVLFGDTSQGGPGYRLQTFPERYHEFRLLVDACATGVFLPVASCGLDIVPGPAVRWVLAAPTLRRPGEPFALGLRAEDQWGNACILEPHEVQLRANGPVIGLPQKLRLEAGSLGQSIENLRLEGEGERVFELLDAAGQVLARSNPLRVQDGPFSAYWGDLHGQSGETVGINPLQDYFEFARDVAFLDVTSHQANDFQITKDFWREINTQSDRFNQDGRFTVFPGYEWSGNTPVGGDHNVFFRHSGRAIHRSSHALLADRSDIDSDAQTLEALFEALADEDCVLYAHIGGRPADISRAHDGRLRTAVELHSDWGSFEWLMADAFALGHRVGLVCNSDGHKGAPGACYPGASEFGAYSGLTCFLATELSRDGIFEAMRRRHHYGTTGCRMQLALTAQLGAQGLVYRRDPALGPVQAEPADRAIMGDIVARPGPQLTLEINVTAHAPLLKVQVLNGTQIVANLPLYEAADLGDRLRIVCQGAEYRGRGRQVHWQGQLHFDLAEITGFSKFNAWNLERNFVQQDPQSVALDTITTGNFSGCDVWLSGSHEGKLSIDTPLVQAQLALAELGLEERRLEAGGLDRCIRVMRLPDHLETCALRQTISLDLHDRGDNQIWLRVETEDGFVAWSSPIYVIDFPETLSG